MRPTLSVKLYKKFLCFVLLAAICLSLAACGSSGYGVKTEKVLVEQDYGLAFRTNDPTIYYVVAAIKVLTAEGKTAELSTKWFGSRDAISFEEDTTALDNLAVPVNKTFTIGVDINSFPMVYISNGTYWGFDIEMAIAVADRLGWVLREQTIEKENVYDELASGNIDCAWGGIPLNQKEIDDEKYVAYGPYIHNDIVIASRQGSIIGSFRNKTLAIPSTPESREALDLYPRDMKKFSNIIRLVGGTTDCFEYLYSGKSDMILTDTTAILYYNSH